MIRTADGTEINEGEWPEQQHAAVFKALKRSLEDVQFPAARERIIEKAGGQPVALEPDIRLGPYLETLPDQKYGSEEDVARALNQTWVKAYRQVQ